MHTDTARLPRIVATLCLLLPALVLADRVFAEDPDVKDATKPAVKATGQSKGVYRLPIPPKDFSPPVLTVEEPVYDWGTVVRGAVVKHTFTVKNTGGTPLIIDDVKPQCGCTAVDKPQDAIPAGGSAAVTLSVDTKRFKGALKKTAKVQSNAGAEPLTLTMQGSVEELFTTDPENPKIDVVRGSSVPSGKMTLRRTSEKEAKVLEISTTSTVIKPILSEVELGKTYEVDIAVELADSKRSYFYENLVAKIEVDGEVIDLPIRVTIVVKDRIDIAPKSAYFPRKDTDTLKTPNAPALTKDVIVKSLGGPEHKFQILEVVNPGTNFATTVETVEEGREYKLIVSLPALPDNQSRTVRDRLTIKTDDPEQPELTITAMGIFAGAPRATSATAQRLQLPTASPAAQPVKAVAAPHDHDHDQDHDHDHE